MRHPISSLFRRGTLGRSQSSRSNFEGGLLKPLRSLSSDLALFSSLLLLLFGVAFSPSFQIIKTEFEYADNLELPEKVPPGKLIVLPFDEGFPRYSVNGIVFSTFGKKQFAVASVYGGDVKVLRAEVETKQGLFAGVFYPPTHRVLERSLIVEKPPVKSGNELRLPASVVKRLSSAEDQRKQNDRNRLRTALEGNAYRLTSECPKKPVNSIVTSQFGRPRTLPSGRSYFHSGVDLRARTGTPIASTLPGQVVFAGPMVVPGNNVIVSHGEGLFSRYLHLSEIKVKTGDRIPASTVVGLAGATGRVEAAHLHWEMIWKGQYADPLLLLEDWKPHCDSNRL